MKGVHGDKKDHLCKICGKTFNLPQGLTAHTKQVHEREKSSRNHKCDLCGKLFATPVTLKDHIGMCRWRNLDIIYISFHFRE